MCRTLIVLLGLTQLLTLASCGDFNFPVSSSDTCSKTVGGCQNSCAAEGKQCCFCDETKNFALSACFCCPKDHYCCSTDSRLGSAGTVCCPNGYECSNKLWGPRCTKLADVPAVPAAGYCNKKCRPDTWAYVTVDDYYSIFIDGVQQDVKYARNWTIPDRVLIPSTAKVITICGTNDLYKAGILIYAENQAVLERARWRCRRTNLECPAYWNGLNVDDSDKYWSEGIADELNNGKDSRKDIVPIIPRDIPWVWCNNPGTLLTKDWDKYCTCRIWLPDSTASEYN